MYLFTSLIEESELVMLILTTLNNRRLRGFIYVASSVRDKPIGLSFKGISFDLISSFSIYSVKIVIQTISVFF